MHEHAEHEHVTAWTFLYVVLIALFTLLLLRVFEYFVEYFNEELPTALKPVVNRILAELAGVGTIATILTLLLAYNVERVEHLSEKAFGEGEALVEVFEYIHTRLFEVAVVFFLTCGWQLSSVHTRSTR